MDAKECPDLLITIFPRSMGGNDRLIAIITPFRELFQTRGWSSPLRFGYIEVVSILLFQFRLHPFDETVIAQERLPVEILPNRLLPYPRQDKVAVALPCLSPF